MHPGTTIASALLLTAVPTMAGTTVPSLDTPALTTSTDSGWRFHAAIPGWLPNLDGNMVIRGQELDIHEDFYSDLLPNLNFAALASFEVGKGKWSFMSDLFYVDLQASASARIANFDMELQQFIGNFAVFYNILDAPKNHLDVYAGARVNWLKVDIDAKGNGPFGKTLSKSGDETWVDPIIGLRYQYDINEKYFIRAVGDVGGFGIESDFTWQAMASVGYRVTDKVSLGLGYKAYGSDFTDGDFTYDLTEHGLLLSLDFTF